MNPFGDSDDDSDDGFNPFAAKKSKSPAPAAPEPEPMPVPKPLVSQLNVQPEAAPSNSNGYPLRKVTSNPFGDDENDDDFQVTPTPRTVQPKSIRPIATKKR